MVFTALLLMFPFMSNVGSGMMVWF